MEKPMVSYCLISYNQENFIRDAIESALKQDYHPLEIIISDDNSSDRTFEIAEQIVTEYKGTHSVILNQNKITPKALRIRKKILDPTQRKRAAMRTASQAQHN